LYAVYNENLGASKAKDRDLTDYEIAALLMPRSWKAMICPFFSGFQVAVTSNKGSDEIIGPPSP